ncbi:DnaT-like ssDNA-binding protein [Pseudaminobacter salicylatoxidans]|uniref:DnaT-like ssDNA-binding protein n=1 Tax=Pseudaminobacter salicylatoxidans TaxID=93369 RepID=UPI0002D621F1|nr:DnaT-like ssDNA-binding protein [Pseudaminobacter salicylatoxidans]
MALIVEDGSGKPDAESYVGVSEFRDYCDRIGYDLAGKQDAEIEQALRRGTRWLDSTYGQRFIGSVARVDQALEWPRSGAVWRGSELPSDTIPRQVQNAACEAAWREAATPGSLSPDYVAAERVKQEQVGDLSVTYMDTAGGAADVAPVVSVIDGMLAGLVAAKAGNVTFGFVARADQDIGEAFPMSLMASACQDLPQW